MTTVSIRAGVDPPVQTVGIPAPDGRWGGCSPRMTSPASGVASPGWGGWGRGLTRWGQGWKPVTKTEVP
jgi:hypothetical protein